MLTLTLLTMLLMALYSHSMSGYVVILFVIYIYLLSNINMFFNSSLSFNLEFLFYDEVSLFMNLLLFFILFLSYLLSVSTFKSHKFAGVLLLSLLFFCFEVFSTMHLFDLYFFYEASLLPILYIIIKWGSYPERSISAIMMISYTLLFSVPMLMIIIVLYHSNYSWLISFYSNISLSTLTSVLIFLCFAVKLPIYGLHYWLPMAHVEAPTFGSVILASVLLKLGGVGLLRLAPLMYLSGMNSVMLSYFMIFTVFSTIVCCFQSDFKRLIAYSSVSHMMVVPLLILSCNILSTQSLVMVMLFHGMSSSLMFMGVGLLYSIFGSRQLVLLRGLILVSPVMSLLLVLTFFYTLSAPPFPSYVAEVYFMFSTYILSPHMIWLYITFAFLGLVYNLNWLSAILFSNPSNTLHHNLNFSYMSLLPFLFILVMTCHLLFLFNFM